MVQSPTPKPQRLPAAIPVIAVVAVIAVLLLAVLPAHGSSPWLPTALALVALTAVGIGVLQALTGLAQTVRQGVEAQTRTLETLLAAPAEALAAQSAELATQATRLAQQGETWQQAIRSLQAAQADMLSAQDEAEIRHEEQIRQLFLSYQESLASFAEEAKHQQSEARAEAQRFTQELQRRQTELLTGLLEQLRAQFVSLQREQADTVQRLIAGGLTQFGDTLEQRVAGIESQVALALQAFQKQLPDAMHSSIQTALSGAVELVDMVREQAGTLAHTVAQVGQNADRQLQAYSLWANRLADWQAGLEQTLKAAQAAQSEMLSGWQGRADQSLSRFDQALDQAAETSRKGNEALAQAINYFGQRIVALEAPLKSLQDQLNALQPPFAALNGAVAQINTPLTANASALDGLNGSTNNLTRALTIVAASEQKRAEQAEVLTTAYTQSMSTAVQRLNDTVQVLTMTLQALQRTADSARPQ